MFHCKTIYMYVAWNRESEQAQKKENKTSIWPKQMSLNRRAAAAATAEGVRVGRPFDVDSRKKASLSADTPKLHWICSQLVKVQRIAIEYLQLFYRRFLHWIIIFVWYLKLFKWCICTCTFSLKLRCIESIFGAPVATVNPPTHPHLSSLERLLQPRCLPRPEVMRSSQLDSEQAT